MTAARRIRSYLRIRGLGDPVVEKGDLRARALQRLSIVNSASASSGVRVICLRSYRPMFLAPPRSKVGNAGFPTTGPGRIGRQHASRAVSTTSARRQRQGAGHLHAAPPPYTAAPSRSRVAMLGSAPARSRAMTLCVSRFPPQRATPISPPTAPRADRVGACRD